MINCISIRPIQKQRLYELYKGENRILLTYISLYEKHFILNNAKDNLEKFDARQDEGIFIGYFTYIKELRAFNKRTMTIEESVRVTFVESKPNYVEV